MTAQEARFELSKAVTQRESELGLLEGDPTQDARDAKDLMRALARLLAGQSVQAAFGSPGDWGYSTPIGRALYDVYRFTDQSEVIR